MSELKQFVVYRLKVREKIYIGSTCDFRLRLRAHKTNCFNRDSRKYNNLFYEYIRENDINFEDVEQEILEEIDNLYDNDKENKKNARIREQYYIDRERENKGDNLLNVINAYTDMEQIKTENAKKREARKAENYKNDKEKRKAEKKAEWYQNNKEKITARKAVYYQNNKEKIFKRRYEKINCECGSTITVHHKVRHERTKIHKDYLKSLEKQNETLK